MPPFFVVLFNVGVEIYVRDHDGSVKKKITTNRRLDHGEPRPLKISKLIFQQTFSVNHTTFSRSVGHGDIVRRGALHAGATSAGELFLQVGAIARYVCFFAFFFDLITGRWRRISATTWTRTVKLSVRELRTCICMPTERQKIKMNGWGEKKIWLCSSSYSRNVWV